MRKTPQLLALKLGPKPTLMRSAKERLEELQGYGLYLVHEKISGKDPYAGFVARGYRDACHPYELFFGNAHEVEVQKRFLPGNYRFFLESRWGDGNRVLLAYLKGRITEKEMALLTSLQFGNEKEIGVNVGLDMIHVTRGEGKLVYKADFEAHRIVRPGWFGKITVTDFLLPAQKYVTHKKNPEIPVSDNPMAGFEISNFIE